MRARTGRSCARCPTCSGSGCPTTRSRSCAPRCSGAPASARVDQIAPGNAADIEKLAARGGTPDKAPFRSPVDDFYLTNPIARASAIMAECSALARGQQALTARSSAMAEFWTSYLWPLIIMVAQSVLLLVSCWSRSPMCCSPTARSGRRCRSGAGRTWSGPWGLLQSFADMLKFVLKEPTIPSAANKGVFLLAPLSPACSRSPPGR
jgi:hypothetical protein